jgi:hypothetical protein
MAGKKFGVVIGAKVPGSYHTLSESDQAIPGKAFDELGAKYAGKVEFVRRLWTGAFTTEVSDVFLIECDEMSDAHNYMQDLTRLLAKGGDPDRFGTDVKIWVGVNPDA